MRIKSIRVLSMAHHRNGIGGEPFHVVLFEDTESPPEEAGRKVGIVFEQPNHCAVLHIAKTAIGNIAFGSNSWRGDEYEPHLRKAIAEAA